MNGLRSPETEAEVTCLEALRAVAGGEGGPIERHGLRVYWIMERLAQAADIGVDDEVSLCAALLHDVGLYVSPRAGRLYLHNGRLFADGSLLDSRGPRGGWRVASTRSSSTIDSPCNGTEAPKWSSCGAPTSSMQVPVP